MSKIPGITAAQAAITDVCRANRGDDGAFDEAVSRLRQQYDDIVGHRRDESGVEYHLVLSVCDQGWRDREAARSKGTP